MKMYRGPWESIRHPEDLENAQISGSGFLQTPKGKLRNSTWHSLKDRRRYGLHKAEQRKNDLR